MTTRDDLVSALSKLTAAHWEQKKEPLLLSDVPRLLDAEHPHIDRFSILGEKSLKAFTKETESGGTYKVIEHPVQRPKVGLLPNAVQFEFPVLENKPVVSAVKRTDYDGREKTVIKFIKLLSALPAAELEKVSIPMSVLVKLLK